MNWHLSITIIITALLATTARWYLKKLLNLLDQIALAIVNSSTIRQALSATFSQARRFPIGDAFVAGGFWLYLLLMFFDPSPITRLSIAFEFLVIATAMLCSVVFMFRLAWMRVQRRTS